MFTCAAPTQAPFLLYLLLLGQGETATKTRRWKKKPKRCSPLNLGFGQVCYGTERNQLRCYLFFFLIFILSLDSSQKYNSWIIALRQCWHNWIFLQWQVTQFSQTLNINVWPMNREPSSLMDACPGLSFCYHGNLRFRGTEEMCAFSVIKKIHNTHLHIIVVNREFWMVQGPGNDRDRTNSILLLFNGTTVDNYLIWAFLEHAGNWHKTDTGVEKKSRGCEIWQHSFELFDLEDFDLHAIIWGGSWAVWSLNTKRLSLRALYFTLYASNRTSSGELTRN